MGKIADRYFKLDPWQIIEEGYDPTYSEVAESIFSLGNEYTGVRGYPEEGTTDASLLGSYFNGIYEMGRNVNRVAYRGIVERTHFMVNTVDWLYTRIFADDEQLVMGKSTISDFKRVLDLKTGTLTKTYVWTTAKGQKIQLQFLRFLHMEKVQQLYQEIILTSLDFTGELKVVAALDFNTRHWGEDYRYWQELAQRNTEETALILGETKTTQQTLLAAFHMSSSDQKATRTPVSQERFVGQALTSAMEPGKQWTLQKRVVAQANKKGQGIADLAPGEELFKDSLQTSFAAALAGQKNYWENVWRNEDIEIVGDEEQQQGIRFCIFQLKQTYHGQDPHNNIGAKGLTGEAYSGHTFWDTETCCLPYYLFTNIEAAKNLLGYRYATLEQAKARAKDLDCQGACFPIATLNGTEACDLWQHASLQFQPSTGVAFGLWHYQHFTADTSFLYEQGLEMLIEISRFLVSRGAWNQTGEYFGFYGVMGPDEFQMMVNHNMYTNIMAKFTLEYTLALLQEVKLANQEIYQKVLAKTNFQATEKEYFAQCAAQMRILKTAAGLYEQHDGFFDLPHVEIKEIPVTDFPLYSHWSYDRIYRNDMIKQPDVLMFMFLLNQQFTPEEKRRNYDFYEPKTIHESSLSPAIHSILANELGKEEDAYRFFEFATRMDLDNYNRNTREGLHTTSIAGAWMNIVYGFGGVRSDASILGLAPSLPREWESYRFKIIYRGLHLHISVTKEKVVVQLQENTVLKVKMYQDEVVLLQGANEFPLKGR
ncbi:glycoside hydrolase family 65 protein [Enterococcus nangangensis]|uniref:glycoside hydrolase family 65 protein n=1 Tax=Enterococcus nangangensis TaxID=2559926 RepID=UPI0010F8EA07|nr:glycosyl hydrolase family 65 protein [Enterococcus nangangensis]